MAHRACYIAILSLSAAVLSVSGVHAQVQVRRPVDLPAQPLETTLIAIGRSAQFNIAYAPDLVAGKRAPAIRGQLTAEEALRRALEGTGLGFIRTPNGSFLIVRDVRPPPKALPLPPVPDTDIRPDEVTEVVIIGYRNSLNRSANLKSRASGLLDSIVTEDILKFPDSNLAEAIQRISGVAVARDQGEGRSISVRGLGPEFSRVLINDFEAQASTDGVVGGANRGRGFDFNVFPSELFSRIDVRKSVTADDSGATIGATINLVTPKPFDFTGRVFSFSAQGSYNDLSDRRGGRFSTLYSNRFFDGRLGALVAVAHSWTPLNIQGVNSGGWSDSVADGGFCRPTTGTGGICDVPATDWSAATNLYAQVSAPEVHHPRFYRYTDLIGEVERTGAIASVQWRPRPSSYLSLNLMSARYETRRTDYFLEAIGFSRGASQGGKPEILVRAATINDNSTLIAGRFDNVDVRSEVIVDNFRTDFFRASLLYKEEVNRTFRYDVAWATSRSRFDNVEDFNIQIDRFNVDAYSFDARTYGLRRPVIAYGFDVRDPHNWYFGPAQRQAGGTGATGPEIRFRPNAIDNTYDVAKLRTYITFSDNLELGAGLEHNGFRFASRGQRFAQGESGFAEPDNIAALTKDFCGLSRIAPPDGTPRCWRVPDVAAFIDYYDLLSGQGRATLSSSLPVAQGLNQSVAEVETAAYLRLKFKTYVLSKTVTGNAGLRWTRTRQTSRYFVNRDVEGQPLDSRFVASGRTTIDLLPTVAATVKINPRRFVKFALASVTARPPLASLAGGTTIDVNGGRRQITFGDPNIKAVRADSFDLAQEFYGPSGELLSIGFFHKHFRNYIQNRTWIAPYATVGLPAEYLNGTGVSVTDEFAISQFVSTPGGRLNGLELYYQGRLHGLDERLRHVGLNLSYTYVDSAITYQAAPVVAAPGGASAITADLTHLSRSAYNLTLFYERRGFDARISVNHRDMYLTSVPGPFGADASGIEPATVVDGGLTYRVNANLTLTVEALNLTDEPGITWDRTATHLIGGDRYSGRQLYIGFRYVN